jgi:hypothetical protein
MDTRLFFAMISSDTWFIRASSFSISTRTVRLVAGFPTPFFFAGAFFFSGAFFGSACTSGFVSAGFSSFFSSVSVSVTRGEKSVSSSPTASSISETFFAAFWILSKLSGDAT